MALVRGYYGSTARDLVSSSVTNNIQPSKNISMEEEPFQFFLPITYISIYQILLHHAYQFYLDQLYKNSDIYSIVYINQKFKWVFPNPTPLPPIQNSQTMRNRNIYSIYWRLDELFLFKFHFYSTILYSSNISFSNQTLYWFIFCNFPIP